MIPQLCDVVVADPDGSNEVVVEQAVKGVKQSLVVAGRPVAGLFASDQPDQL